MSNLAMLFNMVINFAMLLIFIRFMLGFPWLMYNPVEPGIKAVVDLLGYHRGWDESATSYSYRDDLSECHGVGYTPIELFFFGDGFDSKLYSGGSLFDFRGDYHQLDCVVYAKMHPILGIIMQLAEPILPIPSYPKFRHD